MVAVWARQSGPADAVAEPAANALVPVDTTTGTVGKPLAAGTHPLTVALTPVLPSAAERFLYSDTPSLP